MEGAVGNADAPQRPPALQPALQSPRQPEAATEALKQQPFISTVCTSISALCCLSIWLFLYYRESQQKLEIIDQKLVNETNPALTRREASVRMGTVRSPLTYTEFDQDLHMLQKKQFCPSEHQVGDRTEHLCCSYGISRS